MTIEADKFNEYIQFDGNLYECTFLGKTIKNERVYFVNIFLNNNSDGNFDMKYYTETGNFYIASGSKTIPEEFEQLLSDAILNHHM